MKRILTTLTMLLLLVCAAMAGRGGMVYENYHVEAFVHKNNVWDITETIDVNFFEPRHGIYRHIPKEFKLALNFPHDAPGCEETQRFAADIDLEEVSEDYETVPDPSNLIVKIGDPDREFTGTRRYVIKYKYAYPNDRNESCDYIFHSILGASFEDSIRHFTFKVTYEKPLPQQSVDSMYIYSGYSGNQGEQAAIKDLAWDVEGNSIIGEAYNIAPENAITIFTELPEGFFEDVSDVSDTLMNVCWVFAMLSILAIVLSLLKQSRPHITKNVQFYPPEDISSAEVGTIIDGTADMIDLASLVPWFAGKGYIKIKEEERKGFFSKKKVVLITKLKELPDNAPAYQKTFMRLLFFGSEETVCLDDISKSPSLVESAVSSLEGMFNGNEGSDNDHSLTHLSRAILWYGMLWLFSTMAMLFTSSVETFDVDAAVRVGILWSLPFALGMWYRYKWHKRSHVWPMWKKAGLFIVRIATAALLMVALYYLMIQDTTFECFMPDYVFFSMYVPSVILVEFIGRFNVDTPWRADMMGKLLGLREFIETAERQQLEQLQEDDPEYFYRLVPYALVFGLTKRWAKMFDGFLKEPPSWYETSTVGGLATAYAFTSMCDSVNKNINYIATPESSSSGGSSSGGGFSGGGGGGGGGGSW